MANLSITREFERVFTSTMVDVREPLWDNISTHIPAIHWLYRKGQVEMRDGGAALQFNVYKQTIPVIGYVGEGKVTPAVTDPFTRVEYVYKNLAVPFKITGTDILKNSGPNQVFDLIEAIVDVAENSMIEGLGGATSGIFSTADETDETIVTGIPGVLSTANTTTGTVGKLSRSNTYWRQTVGTAITSFATNGRANWQSLYLNTARGNEYTDGIVTTRLQYGNYLNSLTGTIQYNMPLEPVVADRRSVDAGGNDVHFFRSEVMFDANCPASTAYFLMSKYIKLIVHEKNNLMFRDPVYYVDENSLASMVLWSGNLVYLNLARLGVITGGDTA